MTNKEIAAYEKRVADIQGKPFQEQLNLINALQKELQLTMPRTAGTVEGKCMEMLAGLRSFLNTKLMLNACISSDESSNLAKHACRWAAIAAILSLISTVVAVVSLFLS